MFWFGLDSHQISSPCCNSSDTPVPLHFPNPSFPIQILHYISYSLFLFSSRQFPLAGWLTAVCVHASLSPSQRLSVAVACGRPQSHSIINDFGFNRAPRFCSWKCAKRYYEPMGCRWTSCPALLEIQTYKIKDLGLISSLDSTGGSQDIISERVADSVPVPARWGRWGQFNWLSENKSK